MSGLSASGLRDMAATLSVEASRKARLHGLDGLVAEYRQMAAVLSAVAAVLPQSLPETDLVPTGGPEVWAQLVPAVEQISAWSDFRARLAAAQMRRLADEWPASWRPAPAGWEDLTNAR